MKSNSRRKFLKTAPVFTLGTAFFSQIIKASVSSEENNCALIHKGYDLKNNEVILFIGDSITDGGRDREIFNIANNPKALGFGYVNHIAAFLYQSKPNLNLKFYNTGINGNKIKNLMLRWEKDCVDLKPTILSILVGVNDFNESYIELGKGNPDKYEAEYRKLLQTTIEKLPNIKLIVGEPYAIKGCREKVDSWYPEFEKYQSIAKKLAIEFGAIFIPYQEIYDDAKKSVPEKFYTNDGVHPTLAGIKLMSDEWLKRCIK